MYLYTRWLIWFLYGCRHSPVNVQDRIILFNLKKGKKNPELQVRFQEHINLITRFELFQFSSSSSSDRAVDWYSLISTSLLDTTSVLSFAYSSRYFKQSHDSATFIISVYDLYFTHMQFAITMLPCTNYTARGGHAYTCQASLSASSQEKSVPIMVPKKVPIIILLRQTSRNETSPMEAQSYMHQ